MVRTLLANLAVTEVHSEQELQSLAARFSISKANPSWKLSPALDNRLGHYASSSKKIFILSTHDLPALRALLLSYGNEVDILQTDKVSESIVVRARTGFVRDRMLAWKEVLFIDERAEPHTEIGVIGYDRTQHAFNALERKVPSANGLGIVVGIKEQKPDIDDIDLVTRTLPSTLASANVQQHATTMATIIGGAGNSYYDGRGLAHQAKFFSSSFANLFADEAAKLEAVGVSLQNHSYGTIIQSFYGAEANSYDQHSWQHPSFVHIFSAGNQGDLSASEGTYKNLAGFANLTGNFKSAKNIITVGALDNSGTVSPLSSAGPLYDGRLAPQLTAHGPNGTSDAAAMVSATVAVLQQLYKDSNAQQPAPASLIRAILYNTATDIHSKGIDFKTGYGLMNSLAAYRSLQRRWYEGSTLAPGGTWIKTISIPANAAQVKITLCWTDTAATINNSSALVNDLDIEWKNVNTLEVFQPWVLSSYPGKDSLQALPVRKRDSLNTAEQITVELPASGTYEIRVMARPGNLQPVAFHVAYLVDTVGDFEFTSPQTAEDLDPDEMTEANIRWTTSANSPGQTGTLSVSYDHGQSWNLLAQLPLLLREFKWPLKDTSTPVLFRMQTNNGTFLSQEVILSKVTHPRLDFLCVDSFRLSWNSHPFAQNYRVFAMKGGAYMELVTTTSDSFIVFNRRQVPYITYAIEPVLANGWKAIRSRAINIEIQATYCFYKSLNYDLLSANSVKLLLEAGGTDYIDSLFFEKLNSSGQVMTTGNGIKASAGQTLYTQDWSGLSNGANLFRAKIKLKNGAVVYSNVIAVLTSGDRYIYFYPNPAVTSSQLSYITRPGLPGDVTLMLFDLNGRLLRRYEGLPNKIDLSLLPRGVIVYQLLDINHRKLEGGKIIWAGH